jgi:predicted TIM-barrel fold metal-dependent hydrolase
MNAPDYPIVSADGHNMEPPHIWTQYLPKKYQDRAPRLVKDRKGGDAWEFQKGLEPMPIGLATNEGQWGRRYEDNDWFGSTYASIRQGAFNGKERLLEQDIDGVRAEVIFPSQRTMAVFMAQEDDDFHRDGVQAYNDWLFEEFCAPDRQRLIGLAQMPAVGTEAAVRALREAKKAGFKGVIISGWPSGGDSISADDDPFWAAAEEEGMPVHIHGALSQAGRRKKGAGAGGTPFSLQTREGANALVTAGGEVATASAWMSRMIYSEMFDRFPALQLLAVECAAGWVPHFLEHMDDHWWRNRIWTGSRLKMLPSEYFRRNWKVTFIREPHAVLNRYSIGVDNMMWSSDYPHHRNDWPYSRRVIEESFLNVPVAEKRAMVSENAVKLYRLEL